MQWAMWDEEVLIHRFVLAMSNARDVGLNQYKRDWLARFLDLFVDRNKDLSIPQFLRLEEVMAELGVGWTQGMSMDSRYRIPRDPAAAKRKWYTRRAARRLKNFRDGCKKHGMDPEWIRIVLQGVQDPIQDHDQIKQDKIKARRSEVMDEVIKEVLAANAEIEADRNAELERLRDEVERLRGMLNSKPAEVIPFPRQNPA